MLLPSHKLVDSISYENRKTYTRLFSHTTGANGQANNSCRAIIGPAHFHNKTCRVIIISKQKNNFSIKFKFKSIIT